MAALSAIEKWFYGLAHLEVDYVGRRFPGKLRTETNPFKHSETSSTSTYTPDRAMHRAMGVKMVADELLAATGPLLSAAAATATSPGAFVLGLHSGEQFGHNLGSMMLNIASFVTDDRPLSQKFNKGQHYGSKGYKPRF